jgi:hypothetical protein
MGRDVDPAAVESAGVEAYLVGVDPSVRDDQLRDDTPPEVWQAAERLMAAGHDRHEVLHALAFELSHELHPALTGEHTRNPRGHRGGLPCRPTPAPSREIIRRVVVEHGVGDLDA